MMVCEDLISRIKEDVLDTHGFMLSGINFEIVMLYWRIGRELMLERQPPELETLFNRLEQELTDQLPYTRLSFDAKNVEAMFIFARDYPDEGFVEEVFTKLPWEMTTILMREVNQKHKRHWYTIRAILYKWSVSELKTALNNLEYEMMQLSPQQEVEVGLVG